MSRQWSCAALLVGTVLAWVACGGNSGSSTPSSSVNNSLAVVANPGVTGNNVNALFATVTVCVPGSSNCQAIPDVIVDTGSFGLRLLSSAVANLPLPAAKDGSGNPLGNCAQFVSTFDWGPVATADVEMAGEKASSVPIQVMGQTGFPAPPSSCSSGLTETDTQALLGANGILGLGVFQYDCGVACTAGQTAIPPLYFDCPSSGCGANPITVALQDQVQNPVPLFPQDNNGITITLASVGATGALGANGTIEFGIGTQADNALGGATVLGTDDFGGFPTTFQNTSYSDSILDTGSNAIFFLDSGTTGLTDCTVAVGFYCPAISTNFAATNISATSTAFKSVGWTVGNAETLLNSNNSVFNNLAGPNPSNFDFGLPFFFGRTVFVGVEGGVAGNFTGPFFAY